MHRKLALRQAKVRRRRAMQKAIVGAQLQHRSYMEKVQQTWGTSFRGGPIDEMSVEDLLSLVHHG